MKEYHRYSEYWGRSAGNVLKLDRISPLFLGFEKSPWLCRIDNILARRTFLFRGDS